MGGRPPDPRRPRRLPVGHGALRPGGPGRGAAAVLRSRDPGAGRSLDLRAAADAHPPDQLQRPAGAGQSEPLPHRRRVLDPRRGGAEPRAPISAGAPGRAGRDPGYGESVLLTSPAVSELGALRRHRTTAAKPTRPAAPRNTSPATG